MLALVRDKGLQVACHDSAKHKNIRGVPLEFILTVIGTVLVVEGVPWFLSPRGVKRYLGQIFAMPDRQLRGYGLILMVTGLLVVYLGTS